MPQESPERKLQQQYSLIDNIVRKLQEDLYSCGPSFTVLVK